ncbi:MAG: hypothetical protein JWR52_1531 [Marmoricola sp.]|nr:hypothetical protein [Marmoricola sp.]
MEWIRHRPTLAKAAGGVAVLLVLVVLAVLLHKSSPPPVSAPPAAPYPTQPTRAPVDALPTVSPSATPSTFSGLTSKQYNSALANFGKGFSSGFTSGTLNMPGLQGGSVYRYLPKHHVVMTITSDQPIGTIGYEVPTSLHNSSGIVKNVGTHWSLATTAYGSPDYAQLFMQAGARGFPVTCTITVDGRVTEHRSTEGPYGQLICQG